MWTLEEVQRLLGELYLLVKTHERTIQDLQAQVAALTKEPPHDPQ